MDLLESGSGDGGEGYKPNCSLSFDSTNYKILAGLRASMGMISFLCCLAVIFVIIFFKKYRFFSQRLILNVAVAAMIHSLSYTTSRVNYYSVRPIDDPYCYFGGLFNHYTAAVELISIWITTINIFSIGMCARNTSKFEIAYYITTYALPLLWFWVPIWLKAYGTTGGWCGIKFLNSDCQPFKISGHIQFGIWYVPLYISTVLIIVMLFAVAIRSLRRLDRWVGRYDPIAQASKQALRDEIRPLIVYPILYLLLNTFSFISQIYRAINPSSTSPVLSYLRVLTSPLRGAFVALAFAMDKDTRRRLNMAHCKAVCLDWQHRGVKIELMESTTLYSEREDEGEVQYNTGYKDVNSKS